MAGRSPWVEADFCRGRKEEASLKKGIVFRKTMVEEGRDWVRNECLV
jgi:hypothetical protein